MPRPSKRSAPSTLTASESLDTLTRSALISDRGSAEVDARGGERESAPRRAGAPASDRPLSRAARSGSKRTDSTPFSMLSDSVSTETLASYARSAPPSARSICLALTTKSRE